MKCQVAKSQIEDLGNILVALNFVKGELKELSSACNAGNGCVHKRCIVILGVIFRILLILSVKSMLNCCVSIR